ncbi:MAG TPA: SRPBCC family protein [Acidimicrobiales bacterium]
MTTSLAPEDVFDHLLDPWRYPEWLLGASTMRAVDDNWPEVGSRFHHRVGFGPLKVNDRSKIIEIEPPTRLVLHVRATPAVQGIVTFTVEPTAEGSILWLQEEPAVKLGQLMRPVLDPATHVRNKASLRNLADLMERDQDKADAHTEEKSKAKTKSGGAEA